MILYLIQHGKAKSKEVDPERSLTNVGIEETERIADRLRALSPDPSVIWHSTKLRSKQTARIVAEKLGSIEKLSEHQLLAPTDPVETVLEDLDKDATDKMIVGHLPYLSNLLSFLLIGDEEHNPVAFRNSAVICLRKKENLWKIEWILHPDLA